MPELMISHKGQLYPCLIDPEDMELVSRFPWSLNQKGGYAQTTIGGKTVLMSRLIMGVTDPNIQVDHRFHNKLDNRKSMLRVCTRSQNRQNSRKEKNCTSIYKGAYYEKDRALFHAQIGFATEAGTKVFNLGRYSDERLAAKRYDMKALELFGEYACINFASSKEARQLQFPWIK